MLQELNKHKGENEQDDELLTYEELKILEDITLKKIRQCADLKKLLIRPFPISILHSWMVWGGKEEIKEWINNNITDKKFVASFLEQFLSEVSSQSLGDHAPKVKYEFQNESLEGFINPIDIYDKVRNIKNESWLSEKQRIAIDQFIDTNETKNTKTICGKG